MKELIVAFTILFTLFTCSNLSTLSETEDDPELFKVCQNVCQQRYSDAYGVKQHRRVTDKVICCECMRHRGDKKIYINVNEYEAITETVVNEELLKP